MHTLTANVQTKQNVQYLESELVSLVLCEQALMMQSISFVQICNHTVPERLYKLLYEQMAAQRELYEELKMHMPSIHDLQCSEFHLQRGALNFRQKHRMRAQDVIAILIGNHFALYNCLEDVNTREEVSFSKETREFIRRLMAHHQKYIMMLQMHYECSVSLQY